jgi:3',5'-cyclic AMP phosphodiesterase CpdA
MMKGRARAWSPRGWPLLVLLLCACTDPPDPSGVEVTVDAAADAAIDAAVDAAIDAPVDLAPATDAALAPFTIVVLPDTQFYSAKYFDIWEAQIRWILAHREDQRIAFVLHEGDIVDLDLDEQWAVAARNLHALDGKVPYVLATGNHDLTWKGGRITREATLLNRYFPPDALAALPWPTGTFEPGHLENHYQVLEAYGMRWLVLSLEFGPRDAVLPWADELLTRYAELPAIVLTHAYLSDDNTRYDQKRRQPFWACGYGLADMGGCNDGQDLWDKVLSHHDNVAFVFAGHVLWPGLGRLTSDHPSGRHTHQMLANYQACSYAPCTIMKTQQVTLGGDGFLRLVRVNPQLRSALVETYSPFLDVSKTDPDNRFVLDLDRSTFPSMPVSHARRPRAVGLAPVLPPRHRCDGVEVILGGLEATGDGPRTLRACLDGACEDFRIDPDSLACAPAAANARVSCFNDEGLLRLHFFEHLSARQSVTATARDATGREIFSGRQAIAARSVPADDGNGRCWVGQAVLDGARRP